MLSCLIKESNLISRNSKGLENLNIKHILNIAYNPRSNGITERSNKEINFSLRMNEGKQVGKILKAIHLRLNYTYHPVTKHIPDEEVTKRDIINGKLKHIEEAKILENIYRTEEKNYAKLNKGRTDYVYKPKDSVLLKKEIRGKGDRLFDGPFKIASISITGNSVTLINEKKGSYERVNIRGIKSYFEGGSCPKIYKEFNKIIK